jgi:hypothetical protein
MRMIRPDSPAPGRYDIGPDDSSMTDAESTYDRDSSSYDWPANAILAMQQGLVTR